MDEFADSREARIVVAGEAQHHRRRSEAAMGRTVAFVFQGGGSLSAPQVGMLRALTEAGIAPQLVVGTSAGALNALAYASDPSLRGLDSLEDRWLRLRRRHVARLSVGTFARAMIGRADGLLDPGPLAELLRGGTLVAPVFEDAVVPAAVVATDLASGAAVVIDRGDTTSALLATSAFPGIFPPVELGGTRLIDGGVAADIPVLQAEALGADECYVLPAAGADGVDAPPRGPLAMAYHALGQILDASARRDTLAASGSVHVLPAAVSAATNPLDFRDTRRLIDDGYRLTQNWLNDQIASVA
jgi:NTE family protein